MIDLELYYCVLGEQLLRTLYCEVDIVKRVARGNSPYRCLFVVVSNSLVYLKTLSCKYAKEQDSIGFELRSAYEWYYDDGAELRGKILGPDATDRRVTAFHALL